MNDPHVNSIYYTLNTVADVSYEDCQAIQHEETTHKFILDKNNLLCELKVHFPDINSVRSFIDPLLRAWEIESALRCGKKEFQFVFKNADIIDRNPLPSISGTIVTGSAMSAVSVSCSAKGHVIRSAYPKPPMNFMITYGVETLWYRYNLYLQGKEPLLSMAYFCLSFLEGILGITKREERIKITSIYFIDVDVINKLGYLTSERGDEKTARKGKTKTFLSLTGQEQRWVEACVKAIIRRLGESSRSTPSPAIIKMSDLPTI